MVVNIKISALAAMCASFLWLQSCSEGSYIPIFTVDKIEQEVGQLFSLEITVKDGEGKDAKRRTDFDHIGLELYHTGKEVDLELLQWGHDVDFGEYKEIVSDGGATRRYNNLYCPQEFSGTLLASVSGITYSGNNENSIPLEITTNMGIEGFFSLNKATDKLALQLSNAEPSQQYTIKLAANINYLDYGVDKIVTADVEGKINSSWTLANKIDKQKVCEVEFAAKVASNDDDTDDTRIISTVVEFPCLREHDRDKIIVRHDGSVFFSDSTVQFNCRGDDYKEAKVQWSYAKYDKYPAGKTEDRVNLDMEREKTKLGRIANYKPDELCYYIVVKGKYKCSTSRSSSSGGINARAVHGKCAVTP